LQEQEYTPTPLKAIGIDARQKIKRMNGMHNSFLPSYLDEFMWRERWGSAAFDNILADSCSVSSAMTSLEFDLE